MQTRPKILLGGLALLAVGGVALAVVAGEDDRDKSDRGFGAGVTAEPFLRVDADGCGQAARGEARTFTALRVGSVDADAALSPQEFNFAE